MTLILDPPPPPLLPVLLRVPYRCAAAASVDVSAAMQPRLGPPRNWLPDAWGRGTGSTRADRARLLEEDRAALAGTLAELRSANERQSAEVHCQPASSPSPSPFLSLSLSPSPSPSSFLSLSSLPHPNPHPLRHPNPHPNPLPLSLSRVSRTPPPARAERGLRRDARRGHAAAARTHPGRHHGRVRRLLGHPSRPAVIRRRRVGRAVRRRGGVVSD